MLLSELHVWKSQAVNPLDSPQKSLLRSDELHKGPFSRRILFCWPVALNSICARIFRLIPNNVTCRNFRTILICYKNILLYLFFVDIHINNLYLTAIYHM